MSAHKTDRPGSFLGFLFFTVALIFLVLVVVAAWQGWAWITVASDDGNNESSVALTIDKEKVREDVDAAAEQVSRAGEALTAAADLTVVEGDVSSYTKRGENHLLVVADEEGQTHRTNVNEGTEFYFDDHEADLDDAQIAPGSHVRVTYHQPDEEADDAAKTPNAVKLTVLPPQQDGE